jgi:nucleoside-diphosphate-sugar epimerase
MKVTVLGATGGIGRAIAHELHRRGHTVATASRSGAPVIDGTSSTAFDHTARAQTIAACAGADVVVLATQPAYPDWLDQFPPVVDNVVAGVAAAGARLVFVDNLYMYAPAEGPLTEDSPEHATDPKGRLRRRLGRTVLDAHDDGRIRATIGRFSDYYGPHGTNSGLYALGIGPAVAGRRPRGMWDLDQPHTFHYVEDAARGFATLVDDERADGRAWVLPAAPPITQRRLLQLVADATGTRTPGSVGDLMMRIGGLFDPMVRETRSVRVQFDRPWVVDASRFERTFGPVEVTPHEVAVARTVAWCRDRDEASTATHPTPEETAR